MYRIRFFFKSDYEEILIVSKMLFSSSHKCVARPYLWLHFVVGYYVCLGPTWGQNVASPEVI